MRALSIASLALLTTLAPALALAQEGATDPEAQPEAQPDGQPDGEPDAGPPEGTEPPDDGGGSAGVIPTDEGDEAMPLDAGPPQPAPAGAASSGAPVDPEAELRLSQDDAEDTPPPPSDEEVVRAERPATLETEPPPPRYANDPCRGTLRGRPIGPLQVGAFDGNLGVAHRACSRREMALGGDALIVADNDDLYGNIRVNARGRISAPILDPGIEGFVSWELFRWQSLISAVSSQYLGLGYLAFGARGQLYQDDGIVLALGGRLVLPTTTGLDHAAQPLAMDLGFSGAFQVDTGVRFHIAVSLLGSLSIGAGPADPRGGVRLLAGVDLIAAEWISFVLEAAAGIGYLDALDSVEARGGFRFGFSDEVGLELALSFPFVGARAFDDGALPIAASLMLTWNLPD